MAGLIPRTFLDELLARIDIVDVIASRVELKKAGKNYTALCPFHHEKTPSFSVNSSKQFYYCFGCGATGNALKFISEFEHLDFVDAVETLARSLGLDVPREQQHYQQPNHQAYYQLLSNAAEYYQQQLINHSQAQLAKDYLKSRGVTHAISQQYGLGFAPAGWSNLINALTSQANSLTKLEEAGLVIQQPEKQSYYDRFRNRLMFPIRDQRGRVIAFGGRVFTDEKPKYLNSPETLVFQKSKELYGLYEAKQQNRQLTSLVVVEGYMDVIALAQHGITQAVATLGTSVTTDHVRKLFKQTNEIIFCFDGDEAGKKAAWRALENSFSSIEDGYSAKFLFLPQGEDPDSVIRSEGPKQFQQRLDNQSLTLTEYFFQQLESQVNLHSLEGRAKLSKLASPYLNNLKPSTFKQLIENRLAELTGISPSSPTPSALSAQHSTPITVSKPTGQIPSYSQPQTAQVVRSPAETALLLLFIEPTLVSQVNFDNFHGSAADQATQLLIDAMHYFKKNLLSDNQPQESIGEFIGHYYGTTEGNRLKEILNNSAPETTKQTNLLFIDSIKRVQTKLSAATSKQQLNELASKATTLNDETSKADYLKAFARLRQQKSNND
ncbi:DNA primase [Endozoicomonas sp. SM1973]|uniref:DNA primase n=1 Tax=Spartinivicinus marinus TaxID=2994442 RepID=A0A853IEG6_9GAMM|nr:DNA primase [Spartinivicinus marinus]MCX4028014.1 DNA primase [Spartinivicinus marinus]NYZ68361.1 DNA primase [Spartinivicinus marinus]